MRFPELETDPLGTAHFAARCCWCPSPLVVAELPGAQGPSPQVERDGAWWLRCWVCPTCYPRQLRWALKVHHQKLKTVAYYHVPLPSQVPLYEEAVAGGYVLWGGKAGPGKSTGARRWLYHRSLSVPGHEALLLRENWDQLQGNHTIKMAVEVPLLGGKWYETDRRAVFGTGSSQSIIFCGHMAEADAVTRYLGIEYGAIVADEASLYPLNHEAVPVLAELSTRARRSYRNREGAVVKPVVLSVTNPGGPSAEWLRDMHIRKTPDFEKYPALRPVYDEATGEQVRGYRAEAWRYIKAELRDNPYAPPDYAQTHLAVLSGTRYKQLAEGDWDSFAGQFFKAWDEQYHVRRARLAA